MRLPDRGDGAGLNCVLSVNQGAQPLHFFFQTQFFEFKSHEGFRIGTRSMVLIENPSFEGRMPFL
jgi:hypothetical protein